MGPGIVHRGEAWQPQGASGGVPGLCPRLALLLGEAGTEPSARLLRVALWAGSHSLDAERFLLLFLAWTGRDSVEDIRRTIGAPSAEAVRHRLRRLSDAIESVIAEELALLLSEPDRGRMRTALDREGRDRPGVAFLAAVSAAFDEIAARSERSEQAREKECKNSKLLHSQRLG